MKKNLNYILRYANNYLTEQVLYQSQEGNQYLLLLRVIHYLISYTNSVPKVPW